MIAPTRPDLRRSFVALLLVSVSAAASLAAQEARNEAIARAQAAYDDFDSERALELVYPSLDPAAGPADNIWARGVQLLAQIMIEEGSDALAEIWLRWAVRRAPGIRADTMAFLPQVAAAMNAARASVGGPSPGDDVTRTTWMWPPVGVRNTEGRIEIRSSRLPVPIRVLVGGRVMGAGQIVSLRPGSYDVEAAADGYVNARVTREVLPGVTTVLAFDLAPTAVAEVAPQPEVPDSILPNTVETRALARLARLTVQRFGSEPACATGFVVGGDGTLLTTYGAIRGAESVEARFTDGSQIRSGITVAAHDVGNDVAVLKLPAPRPDSLVLAREIRAGQYAWSLGFPDCGSATATRLRIAPGGPGGLLQVTDTRTGAELGGPLVDQSGAVLGLGTGSLVAVPVARASALLTRARRNIAVQQLRGVGEVARQENHIYGSVALSSSAIGAMARITPLEAWHWPELEQSGFLPLTFTGPIGRYGLEMSLEDQVRHRSEFTLHPGVLQQLSVAPDLPPPQIAVQPKKGGGFPLPIVLLGIAGAGAAGAVLALSGGEDGTRPPIPPQPGSITIRVPNP